MQKVSGGTCPIPGPARGQAGRTRGDHPYQGQVLDPDGRPFAGAALYLVSYGLKHPDDPPIRATSGADGRFRFEVPKSDFDHSSLEEPWSYVDRSWPAPRAWPSAWRTPGKAPAELTLRLARDDVPISGRIIDLQGRPVAGATVTVLSVGATPAGRLDDYLKALQERNEVANLGIGSSPRGCEDQPEPPVIPPVRTGADGRFRIAGIGRERVATLQIEGPTIETPRVMVRTRPGATLRVPYHKDGSAASRRRARADHHLRCHVRTRRRAHPPDRGRGARPRYRAAARGHHGPRRGSVWRSARSSTSMPSPTPRAIIAWSACRRAGKATSLAVPPCDFPYYGRRKAQLKVPPDESSRISAPGWRSASPKGPGRCTWIST